MANSSVKEVRELVGTGQMTRQKFESIKGNVVAPGWSVRLLVETNIKAEHYQWDTGEDGVQKLVVRQNLP